MTLSQHTALLSHHSDFIHPAIPTPKIHHHDFHHEHFNEIQLKLATIHPFRSQRLIYRQFASPDNDAFFDRVCGDALSFLAPCPSLPKPNDLAYYQSIREYLAKNTLLWVVMYRAREGAVADATQTITDLAMLEPVGMMFLKAAGSDVAYHQNTELGIDIAAEFQGQGYGTEAINWVLDWAFDQANQHRVELMALGWNPRAVALYERIGFRKEGIKRECLYKDGKWWDEYGMGILKIEHAELKKQRVDKTDKTPQ